jgi:hypothetical protein
VLKGRVEILGTWRVTSLTAVGGVLRVILRVEKKLRVSELSPNSPNAESSTRAQLVQPARVELALLDPQLCRIGRVAD